MLSMNDTMSIKLIIFFFKIVTPFKSMETVLCLVIMLLIWVKYYLWNDKITKANACWQSLDIYIKIQW